MTLETQSLPEFKEFGKISRLNREVIVTEKIDGTNACIVVNEAGGVYAQSRNRIITPDSDNYGFARWVEDRKDILRKLGVGYHYGEWWGLGINRGYDLKEKRFSLFNVSRWSESRPSVCEVVPTLTSGTGFGCIGEALGLLRANGSYAARGFNNPEGVVAYHTASNSLFKVTLEKDEAPKSMNNKKNNEETTGLSGKPRS